jgi:hypothetical protein
MLILQNYISERYVIEGFRRGRNVAYDFTLYFVIVYLYICIFCFCFACFGAFVGVI